MRIEHARGALLGMAVGDALGTTYEFKAIEQRPYPELATGPATDVVGKGPFGLVAGQITDDTQLAVCLARSLHERRGLDTDDLAQRYVAWAQHAFDIGNQTSSAISRLRAGETPSKAGLEAWRASGRRAAGNGSLMRTAPVAVAFASRPDALIDAAIADSLVTHADPRCLLACAVFDAAIGAAIRGELGAEASMSAGAMPSASATLSDGAAMVAVARAALPVARARVAWCEREEVELLEAAERELESDLDAALAADPRVYSPALHVHSTAGFVRLAFRLAFWHCAHTPSWKDALVDVASRGGDADTNAAIVGALLGARDGAAAIPSVWVERVLAVTQPGPADWAEAHHPRHLLALLDRAE